MKNNFKEIAEKVLNEKISGTFVLRNGWRYKSSMLERTCDGCYKLHDYLYSENGSFTEAATNGKRNMPHEYDIVEFNEHTKFMKGLMRALFVPSWILSILFMAVYFIPACLVTVFVWFFKFNYLWIIGDYDNFIYGKRTSFIKAMEEIFSDVFLDIVFWPITLIDDFEDYVKNL